MESYLQLDKYSNFKILGKRRERKISSHLDWATRSERNNKDQ
jgi:hypothetical protein